MPKESTNILYLDYDSVNVIFGFLHFRDAVKMCMLNKGCYAHFIIICYQNSFVPLDLRKKLKSYFVPSSKFCSLDMFPNLFSIQHVIFFSSVVKMPRMHIADQIKNADCLRNVICLEKRCMAVPKKLKHISFGREFNAPWNKGVLPDSIVTISFHERCKFNFDVDRSCLPSNLRKISFGHMFNKSIDDLPDTVEVLFFCQNSKFNKVIKKFPSSLRELYLGDDYNRPLVNLPDSVEILHFSIKSRFNLEIQYPINLKKICFGKSFNQPLQQLSRLLELTTIKFHNCSLFNLPVEGAFQALKSIRFGINFNNHVNLCNCPVLLTIKFSPKSKFNSSFSEAPKSLEYLYLGKNFNHDLWVPNTIKIITFPNSSKFVKIIYFYIADPKSPTTPELIMGKKYKDQYKNGAYITKGC